MVALGKAYIGTIIYWPHDMSLPMKAGMTLIMSPVELDLAFHQAVRARDPVVREHDGGSCRHCLRSSASSSPSSRGRSPPCPCSWRVGVSLLEVMVALVQAFIFALLASVFIGLGRQVAH